MFDFPQLFFREPGDRGARARVALERLNFEDLPFHDGLRARREVFADTLTVRKRLAGGLVVEK